ncbi:MAG: tRNA-dihydrouridine synthase, partial [Planctomycetaceae bacterium]
MSNAFDVESRTAETGSGRLSDETCLRIGDRVLPSRYFLAPLAGYTHLAFRLAIRELGGVGLCTTDLVPAGHLVRGTRKSRRLVTTDARDRPLSVQIFGHRPEALIAAAEWLQDRGYGGVDVNMGCPMGKVNKSGGGARLMCDAEATAEMIGRVVEAV